MGKDTSMMRLAVVLSALVAVATAVPAGAQAPSPTPSPHVYKKSALQHKAKPMTFSNPGNPKYNPGTQSGRDCISGRGANAGQQTINPITGQPKPATIVSIPLGNDAGSVASSTTKAQQAQACGHAR
jgi:hypothetical protein